jgi:GxxExxY protein
MPELIFKEQSYQIIGLCMEVHRELGHGFKEVVYKDALEYELQQAGIHYQREKQFVIPYKGIVLQRKYCADFIVYDEIVIEAKVSSMIVNEFISQTINFKSIGFKTWHHRQFWPTIVRMETGSVLVNKSV